MHLIQTHTALSLISYLLGYVTLLEQVQACKVQQAQRPPHLSLLGLNLSLL